MLVHYAGVGCEMSQIMEIAQKHNLPVIEDTAHGLFGKYEASSWARWALSAVSAFMARKTLRAVKAAPCS